MTEYLIDVDVCPHDDAGPIYGEKQRSTDLRQPETDMLLNDYNHVLLSTWDTRF